MEFIQTTLKDSYLITLDKFKDDRGWFTRTFCKKEFKEFVGDIEWVETNHSYTRFKGTLRGMHFQMPPFSEAKLVRCIRGTIFDVIVDLRKGSETFLHWYGVELSFANQKMLYVPKGFAHGFQSLEDRIEMIYCHSSYYNSQYESGINFDDPRLNIQWRCRPVNISERDRSFSFLDDSFEGI